MAFLDQWIWFVLLVPLVGVSGWVIGRRGGERHSDSQVSKLSTTYFRGLNYLLNEQPDKAIELFLHIAELDRDTFETQVALGLVDADQVAQCLRRALVDARQVGEHGLGAIEQPGAHVVLAQRQQRLDLLRIVEVGTLHQRLVQPDRAVDLAAPAEQVPEREMRLDRVAVDLGELQEHLDRLVLLLVQEVVEAAEVVRRKLADARAGRALAAAPADDPA